MKAYPHVYVVAARAAASGPVEVSAAGLPTLATAPPAEFDGPGDAWSPETMLVAAVADCFVLTFRAVARASRLEWHSIDCATEGVLERPAGGLAQFSRFTTRVTLTVPPGVDHARAQGLLERAEHSCLVANSLKGERALEARVVDGAPGAALPQNA